LVSTTLLRSKDMLTDVQVPSSPRRKEESSHRRFSSRRARSPHLVIMTLVMDSTWLGDRLTRVLVPSETRFLRKSCLSTFTTLTLSLNLTRTSSPRWALTRFIDFSMWSNSPKTKNSSLVLTTCKEEESTLRITTIDSATRSVQ